MKRKPLYKIILALSLGILAFGCSSEPDNTYFDSPYEDTPDSNNTQDEGTNIPDSEIRKLIDECVTVNAKYEDYIWYFTIESNLHHKLPNNKIQFGIGHGDINGIEQVSIENDAYEYSCQNDGRKKIMSFANPFWFYYVFGMDPSDKENWTHSEMYHATYTTLREKGYSSLNEEEKAFYTKLVGLLNDLERPAIRNYHPAVEVLIDKKFYCIQRYQVK